MSTLLSFRRCFWVLSAAHLGREEELVLVGVVDHAHHHLLAHREADGHAGEGQPDIPHMDGHTDATAMV